MRQGIYRFQTRPDHHLTEFGMLVSLFQPRSFVGQILVDITESLNRHIGTSLQFKIVHLRHILSADNIHVNGRIRRRWHIWNDTSTKLLTQIGGTMHQIAQGITQIGIVHIPKRSFRKRKFSTIWSFFTKIPPKGIDIKLVQHVMRINDIADTLGHFLSFLVIDETMRKYCLGERNPSGHEQTRPNDGMEPQNILSNNVNAGGPEFGQSFLGIWIGIQPIDTRQVIGKGINPNVHDVLGIEAFWSVDTPFEGGSRNTQIPKRVGRQSSQNSVAMLFGTNKVGIVLNIFDQLVMIRRHFEKVRFFLYLFERQTGSGIFEIGQFGFRIRDKGFFSNIVPSIVSIQINISIGMTFVPEFLSRLLVTIRCGANVIVVCNEDSLVEALKASHVLKN